NFLLYLLALCHDVEVFAPPDHLEFAQFQPPVADAFAGLEVVFIAVPRAGEMHLVGECLPLIGAVRRDHVHHLVDDDAFAGRPAGMDAIIAVGVVGAVLAKHADLVPPGDHDAAVAILHVGGLGDEGFGHFHAPHADLGIPPPGWRDPNGARRLHSATAASMSGAIVAARTFPPKWETHDDPGHRRRIDR